jgi:hypothetical protein
MVRGEREKHLPAKGMESGLCGKYGWNECVAEQHVVDKCAVLLARFGSFRRSLLE